MRPVRIVPRADRPQFIRQSGKLRILNAILRAVPITEAHRRPRWARKCGSGRDGMRTTMRGPFSGALIHQLERLFQHGTAIGLTEGELLERFVRGNDEAAFEALIARHGPMVLGVCRQFLRDPNDVDDAFQATFLVLVRRAGTLRRRDLLGNWLYGVAHRVAMRSRAVAARRSARAPHGQDVVERLDAGHRPAEWRRVVRARPRAGALAARGGPATAREVPDSGAALLLRGADRTSRPPRGSAARSARSRAGWPAPATCSAGGWSAAASRSRPRRSPPPGRRGCPRRRPRVLEIRHARGRPGDRHGTAGALIVAATSVSLPVAALTDGVLRAMIMTQAKVIAIPLLIAGIVTTGAVIGTAQQARDDPNLRLRQTRTTKGPNTPTGKWSERASARRSAPRRRPIPENAETRPATELLAEEVRADQEMFDFMTADNRDVRRDDPSDAEDGCRFGCSRTARELGAGPRRTRRGLRGPPGSNEEARRLDEARRRG